MKLIDILARELKVWPGHFESLIQDYDGLLLGGTRISFLPAIYTSSAEDWKEAIVTQSQWQAAVDALAAQDMHDVALSAELGVIDPAEWNGEGLPPVGTFCEYERLACKLWIRCEILAHRNNAAVVIDDSYDCELVESRRLRPIRTAEQIAAEERLAGIMEIERVAKTGEHLDIPMRSATAVWDAGYRKQVAQ